LKIPFKKINEYLEIKRKYGERRKDCFAEFYLSVFLGVVTDLGKEI